DDVLRWIQTYGDKPFYAYVHYMDVHCPYDTIWYPLFNSQLYPSQNLKEKITNIYDGRIVYVDQQIKRIWEELRRLNLSKDTLLLVTADHGEELYDHEGRGHMVTLYDELIWVPLIMVNPALSQMGQRVETQVQLIDLPVTVLDFLRLEIPEQMRGQSLLPLIGDTPPLSEPAYALSYTTMGRKSLKTEEGRALWKKKVWLQEGILTALRIGNQWKIVVGDDGRVELYNLKKDKKEQNDLKEREQLMVEDLKRIIREELSTLKIFIPKEEKQELSPDARNRLKALGYL
ncbi:MAG: sulfatase-like hydrolase/transferase, partial [Deltaproteobacteria bacterium]|nr:sulfatase-like hydrolase/transferase [Deltaproteobacteria bacterium]